MKWCGYKKHWVDVRLFSPNKSSTTGLQSWCKSCLDEYKKLRRKLYPELLKEQRKKHYEKRKDKAKIEHSAWTKRNADHVRAYNNKRRLADPEQKLWENAHRRARERNIKFTITKANISIPEFCPVLGIPLFPGKGKLGDNSPSLDRIDNAKGYIPGNIRVISYKANRAKGNLTKEEIKALYLDSLK